MTVMNVKNTQKKWYVYDMRSQLSTYEASFSDLDDARKWVLIKYGPDDIKDVIVTTRPFHYSRV